MPFVDRKTLIDLLERLRGDDDADVAAAGREIVRRMDEAGLGWEDLLVPEDADEGTAAEEGAAEEDFGHPTDHPDDDAALIDLMLAKYELSDDTRDELVGYKQDIAEGEFTDADSDYIRALKARLDGSKS